MAAADGILLGNNTMLSPWYDLATGITSAVVERVEGLVCWLLQDFAGATERVASRRWFNVCGWQNYDKTIKDCLSSINIISNVVPPIEVDQLQ